MRPRIKILNSVFEIAHVEFQTYDISNHKLLFSSGLAHRMLGYSEDEYINLSNDFYKDIVHPDDFPTVQQTVDKIKAAKSGDVIEMTIRLLTKAGSYIWAYSRQMIYDRSADSRTFLVIREVDDVTKLIEIQNELEEKVRQLKIVSFKNSHLLRSPVASIIGLVDLIDEQGITSEHNTQIFNFLKEAIVKLDGVIHEINDAARV